MSQVPIPFPLGGLNLGTAHNLQPQGTTPSASNVRAMDPRTRRVRGGQRAGLSRFNANQIGSAPITDGVAIVRSAALTTYTLRNPPTVEWTKALPAQRTALCMATDPQSGDLFVGCVEGGGGAGINYLAKINPAGDLLWSFPVPLPSNNVLIKSVRLDEDGAIYVCLSGSVGANLLRYEETGDAYVLRKTWELTPPNGGGFVDVAIRNGVLYVIENTGTKSYLHQYAGIGTFEPTKVWSAEILSSFASLVSICVGVTPDGAAVVGFCDVANPPAANGRLAKYGPNAPTGGPPVTAVWTYNGTGVGQAVVCGEDGSIWSQGFGAENVRKLTDAGSSVSSAWALATSGTHFKGAQTLDVDRQGNVYQAVTNGTSTRLVRIKADGSAADWTLTSSTIGGAAYSVVVDPFDIDAGTRCEFVYVGTGHSTGSVQKLSLQSVSQAEGPTRSLHTIAVVAGDIKTFQSTGSVTTPSGGTGAMVNSSRFGCLFPLGAVVFGVDGRNSVVVDLDASTPVTKWEASSGGEVPRRQRLGAAWNGRAVLAGSEEEPTNWFMSAVGDAFDWEYFPAVTTTTQAVAGNFAPCGKCPDIINALIPYSDDLLIFGCDHTLYRLTGDPAAGGQFDLISDVTGVAWGKAWCKDQRGTVFFFGSRGGVYAFTPGGAPELISQAIDEELMAVDLANNRVRLAYDDRTQTLHVFITPFSAGATSHYAYEVPGRAWWKDVFGSTTLDPLSVWVSDGDAEGDRAVVLGCRDGFARKIDVDATRDDGTDIVSSVVLGPVRDPAGATEVKLTDLRCVLPAGSSSIDYTVQFAETPEYASPATAFSGTWAAGRNQAVWERARGASVWIRLASRSGAQTWAFELLTARVAPAGRARDR